MTNTIDKAQPEALRLAAALSQESEATSRGVKYSTAKKAAAELRTLDAENQLLRSTHDRLQTAFNEWADKTEWVRKTIHPHELGKHIADILRERIETMADELATQAAQIEACRAEAARYQWLLHAPVSKQDIWLAYLPEQANDYADRQIALAAMKEKTP